MPKFYVLYVEHRSIYEYIGIFCWTFYTAPSRLKLSKVRAIEPDTDRVILTFFIYTF